jgi:hypothetical protein
MQGPGSDQKWAAWNGIMALGIDSFAVVIITINDRLRREPVQNSVKV